MTDIPVYKASSRVCPGCYTLKLAARGGVTHLDHGLATEGGAEEDPEGHEEVAAADAAQVKQGVRPCRQQEDAPEAMPASPVMHDSIFLTCRRIQLVTDFTHARTAMLVLQQGTPIRCKRHMMRQL